MAKQTRKNTQKTHKIMETPIYQTVRPSQASDLVVVELNAAVCVQTFAKRGNVLADLYKSNNSAPVLVAHGSTAPCGYEFNGTYQIHM